jgi:hypothetical protein
VADVIVDALEHQERGLARSQAEALAELADPDLVQPRLAFERAQGQPRPLHGGQARSVAAGVDADRAGGERAVAAAQAQLQVGALRGHHAGEHEAAGSGVARLHRDVAGAERARLDQLGAARQQNRRRLLVGQRLQVDAAAAARLGEGAQGAGSPLVLLPMVNTGTGKASRHGAP